MSAPAVTVAALQKRVAELEAELAEARLLNGDLKDLLQSCRARVDEQQTEHSAYRLLNPPRRETP